MNEGNRKNTQCVTPHTKRNVSNYNWDLHKNIICDSHPVKADTPGEENVKKSSVRHRRRSKKKHTLILSPDAKPQLNIEQDHDNSKRKKLTKHIAMDCEMVGIGDGTQSMIARVSIVNSHGDCIYDKYVIPREPVKDYRTKVSGIRPHNLESGEEFQIVQKEVAEILRGRVLIGHALKYDLDVLYLSHPRKHLRDTSRFKTFRSLSKGNTPSLKKLAHELLGREIQTGEHSSVEDAKAAMQLYVLYKNKWESEFYSKR